MLSILGFKRISKPLGKKWNVKENNSAQRVQINFTSNAKVTYVLTANFSKINKSVLPNISFIFKTNFSECEIVFICLNLLSHKCLLYVTSHF